MGISFNIKDKPNYKINIFSFTINSIIIEVSNDSEFELKIDKIKIQLYKNNKKFSEIYTNDAIILKPNNTANAFLNGNIKYNKDNGINIKCCLDENEIIFRGNLNIWDLIISGLNFYIDIFISCSTNVIIRKKVKLDVIANDLNISINYSLKELIKLLKK